MLENALADSSSNYMRQELSVIPLTKSYPNPDIKLGENLKEKIISCTAAC
jgi:hypothetical protein